MERIYRTYTMIALLERWRELLKNHLAACIVLLFAVQPLMDICSFWLDKLGMSTTPTLLLRMLVFALTALIGFCLSDKKRYYWGLAAICAVFFVCHAVSCMRAGYISPFADLTNYIRVIQIPIFALCLITFLRADTQSYHWVGVGFAVSFAIISAVVLLSVATGTNPYTYVWHTNQNGHGCLPRQRFWHVHSCIFSARGWHIWRFSSRFLAQSLWLRCAERSKNCAAVCCCLSPLSACWA